MDFALAGWRKESEDQAEKHWSFDKIRSNVPGVGSGDFDLRPFTSPRQDQRLTNSCVSNSLVKALEIKRIQKYGHGAHIDLSRLANYYLSRELMNPSETDRDEGTYVSTAADALRRFGVCKEVDWPFDERRLFTSPSWRAMRNAYVHKISSWYRIGSKAEQRVEDVIANLAVGNPTVFGVQVTQRWLGYKEGILDVPGPSEPTIGGHAIVIVGWLENYYGGVFVIENSWATGWGDDGFGYVSPDLIESNYTSDFVVMMAGFEDWAPKT